MIINKSDFELSAVKEIQYPSDDLPEIALSGRSNVGKSSFINAMLGRKNLARTSSTPGKTRLINFYRFNERYRFVDLPGYGYAKVSKSERESWAKIINRYLSLRKNLREVVLVVDIRHPPTDNDMEMYSWILDSGFSGLVVATKLDKLRKNEIKKNISVIKTSLKISDDSLLFPFSAEKKNRSRGGVDCVRSHL